MHDERRAREQFEEEQERLEKEQSHYENVLMRMRAMGDAAGIANAQANLITVQQALEGVLQRAANIRAGYVYA